MIKRISFSASLVTSLAAGTMLSFLFAGCMTTGSVQSRGHRGYQTGVVQTTVVFEDDYDYYPGYEIYYSRNRHEYVYRDGSAWVRRPEPVDVSLNILLAAPSVRLDFHDTPERHHASVIKTYPRNWHQPAGTRNNKDDHRDSKKNDKKGENRKDRDDHRQD